VARRFAAFGSLLFGERMPPNKNATRVIRRDLARLLFLFSKSDERTTTTTSV